MWKKMGMHIYKWLGGESVKEKLYIQLQNPSKWFNFYIL